MLEPRKRRSRNWILVLLRLQALCFPAAAWGSDLTVTVAGIEGGTGQLMVAIVDGEDAFDGQRAPLLSLLLPPSAKEVTFSTDALPPGDYGVRVMHDVNGNGEMDENLVGMPTEPWGFSNNAMGSFGPPGWQDVRFTLNDALRIRIDLNH
ncbi:MAG: DUF2141 domain-containing protein [Pseudomonadales bacterium]